MWEIIAGVIVVVVALVLPRFVGNSRTSLRIPKIKLRGKRKEKMEEEIDSMLNKVASEGFKKPNTSSEISSDVKAPSFETLEQESRKNVEIEENLLEEMQTGTQIFQNTQEEPKTELPALPEEDSFEDLSMDGIEEEVSFLPDDLSEKEGDEEGFEDMAEEEEVKVEFDEEDDLISSLAKEVEMEEEEEIDLLRDLKDKKFSATELESELADVLKRLKAAKGNQQARS